MYKDEYKAVCNSAAAKLNLLKNNPLGYFVASILAGMFVAMGSFVAFTLAGHLSGSEAAAIWAKPAQSAAFAAALSLVIMAGADLFTGNNFVMSAAIFRKTATVGDACKLWCVCWIGNLVGSLLSSALFVAAKVPTGGIGDYFENLAEEMMEEFKADFEHIRIKTLLSGEYDKDNAIVTLHAGAGGTESCDWASMLYRMYLRWADRQGFTTEVLDYLDGDEAGIKSVTFQVNGENAYGYLKSEKGVHRLVRISPFNAAGKRQTSFVSCDVMPDIEEDVDIEINQDDLKIDTYRSSGAGGQHINKTSSAVRITHLPTGIVVQCQNERSQFQNKDKAMQMLKAKLYLLKQQENEKKLSGIQGELTEIGWGNQIRSYVMQPYTMVKDHRTNEESGNVDAVMNGNIDNFINAYLKWVALGKMEK